MRNIICYPIVVAMLAAGACKQTPVDTGTPAVEAQKAATAGDDQRKELDKAAMNPGPTTVNKVNKTDSDLATATADLAAARDKYSIVIKDRLAKLDAQIEELTKRADDKSKEALDALRIRRAELAAKLDTMKDRTAAEWDAFTKSLDGTFDTLEKQVHDALK